MEILFLLVWLLCVSLSPSLSVFDTFAGATRVCRTIEKKNTASNIHSLCVCTRTCTSPSLCKHKVGPNETVCLSFCMAATWLLTPFLHIGQQLCCVLLTSISIRNRKHSKKLFLLLICVIKSTLATNNKSHYSVTRQ